MPDKMECSQLTKGAVWIIGIYTAGAAGPLIPAKDGRRFAWPQGLNTINVNNSATPYFVTCFVLRMYPPKIHWLKEMQAA